MKNRLEEMKRTLEARGKGERNYERDFNRSIWEKTYSENLKKEIT